MGKMVTILWVEFDLAHGKIVEQHWAEADFFGLLQQLAALKSMGKQG